MRFKIDENLHPDAADLFRRHGHDALTVYEQALRGSRDVHLATVCKQERRALVTLDLDFSDIRAYPPREFQGIIVLRVKDQSRPAVLRILSRIMPLFESEQLAGHLWILRPHEVRIRKPGERRPS